MKTRSLHPMVVAGAAVTIAVLVFVTRPARRADQAPAVGAATPSSDPQRKRYSERVQQRLEQLRAGRADGTRNDRIDVQSSLPPAPARITPAAETAGDQDADAEGDPDDIPTLTRIALKDTDPARRLGAVTLLGALDDPQVVPVLAQAVADEDEEVRSAAIESLGDFTGDAPVDAIETALHDRSTDVRYEAVNVLADIGGSHARQAIETALNDADDDVRSLAEGVLDLEHLYEGTPAPGDAESSDRGS